MRLSDALDKTAAELAGIAGPDAHLQALWMLQSLLGVGSEAILTRTDAILTAAQEATMKELIRRRMKGEPLQYVLGTAQFRNLTLRVDRRALIPRPETEGLVEIGLEFLQHRLHPLILDIGTGCGAIALSLLNEHPTAHAVGCDVSAVALDLADENARELGLDHRAVWRHADFYDAECANGFHERFDLVISNPPYVSETEYEELSSEIRDWEPALALLAGKDGLDAIRRLAQMAGELLHPGGWFVCEMGEKQKRAALRLFREFAWDAEVRDDLSGKPRYLVARRR